MRLTDLLHSCQNIHLHSDKRNDIMIIHYWSNDVRFSLKIGYISYNPGRVLQIGEYVSANSQQHRQGSTVILRQGVKNITRHGRPQEFAGMCKSEIGCCQIVRLMTLSQVLTSGLIENIGSRSQKVTNCKMCLFCQTAKGWFDILRQMSLCLAFTGLLIQNIVRAMSRGRCCKSEIRCFQVVRQRTICLAHRLTYSTHRSSL